MSEGNNGVSATAEPTANSTMDESFVASNTEDTVSKGEPSEKRRKVDENCTTQDTVAEEDEALPAILSEVSSDDLQVAVRVLQTVSSLSKKRNGLIQYKHSSLRPLRKAMAGCLQLQSKLMYDGKSEEDHISQKLQLRSMKRQRAADSSNQQKYIEKTQLRKGRVEKLRQLQSSAQEEERQKLLLLVPDGHVETVTNQNQTSLLENGDDTATANTSTTEQEPPPVQLPKLRSCYVCKVRYRRLHEFYDQLCESCAPFNWEKRHQTANLESKVAVVTGSRVKIGYQTCLKLLRAGATVVATTRFPNLAAQSYQQEADFAQWKDRLEIYGLDLRDVTGLEAFTRFLKQKFVTGIDIVINNACQTVRRPRGYYAPLVEQEQALWSQASEDHRGLLEGCVKFERVRRQLFRGSNTSNNHNDVAHLEDGSTSGAVVEEVPETNGAPASSTLVATPSASSDVIVQTGQEQDTAPFETTGVSHSAAMSQMILLPEDAGVSDSVLPPGCSDINGHQLDLRTSNSWLLKMEQVSTPEIMECMFINAIAPFVLNSRLTPLMCFPDNDEVRPDRFIINVSAMEGKFYRYKMPNHPHTNMAKAALNMMTRTSAEDLAKKHRIYMNAVDTGWINDENPLEKASKIAKTNSFQTPIDEIDAAARILDPIFTGINGGRDAKKEYGKFLKDFRETEW